jgi:hypothetical protein
MIMCGLATSHQNQFATCVISLGGACNSPQTTRERNRVQKLLEHVNVKIGNVLSDVFGVSGQNMLLALLSGEATPEQIAQLARGQSLGLPGRGDRGMGCRNTAADADAAV